MADLTVETDPAEAGLDPVRLSRIDRHFARYVEDGRLPGWLLTIRRHGSVVHVAACGERDVAAALPVETGTLWRIYSMTKPVTSVAAMMLAEEGAFELTDPVSEFIPSFASLRVYAGGSDLRMVTVPATEPVRIWHLLTHTAGLTYGFHRVHPVDAAYRAAGFEWSTPRGMDLAGCCDAWASLPLLFQPGAEWNYSVATDVLGRVVEVASGQRLDEFLASRILGPLGMTDTAFHVPAEKASRLAALYAPRPATGPGAAGEAEGSGPVRRFVRLEALSHVPDHPPRLCSGGGGLISTARDYNRFLDMLLDRRDSPAGEVDGVRLLSPRTVAFMTRNHLPGGADLATFGRPLYAESPFTGTGFGLGFAVLLDATAAATLSTEGEYSWGGAASTAFWVDDAEDLTVTFFTQLLPSSTYPIRSQLRQLVYQAMVR